MRKEFKPIQIGDIETKDICLNSFVLRDNSLVFKGKVNSVISELKKNTSCNFTLTMKEVNVINAITTEEYNKLKLDLKAPLIEMVDKEGGDEEGRTFIIVAMDWAYTVVCKDYELMV